MEIRVTIGPNAPILLYAITVRTRDTWLQTALIKNGMPGQLFYSLHVPINEEEMVNSPITSMMTILEGKGSMAKVTTELQYLVSSSWDWQVKKVGSNEYMFVVPSAKELDFLTRFKEFTLWTNLI